jgi:hypothetical protein
LETKEKEKEMTRFEKLELLSQFLKGIYGIVIIIILLAIYFKL